MGGCHLVETGLGTVVDSCSILLKIATNNLEDFWFVAYKYVIGV